MSEEKYKELCLKDRDVVDYIISVLRQRDLLYDENIQLKSVLKEIREYINKMEFDEYGVFYDNGKNLFVYEPIFKDIALEIIDKGLEEDK